ncbi:ADP-ribosylglycohydrolase family protein [Burkholderia ubonensis]|uniref:ADP-ribosylglycohydrolase family protein n=1 Tax=Burkholderia ubonensis TaxID=101571 RepID=UPI0015CA704C|nr:ADP-ribosylglycohydrolase family protein [Burkholderia ubonensis]
MNSALDKAIVNSALWAAAGDALGWITELTDERGVRRRVGAEVLHEPIAWKRKIGGISGTQIQLPAGTYSDDTQLRLAVCRAIRGDGTFDVELFAKVELAVWPAYALGAGRGSKAAAANLAKRDVNWFSNFFSYGDGRSYVDAGGNGAAMRIQPHVWRRAVTGDRSFLLDVIRDSLTTHGSMLGLCGAVFHADCLSFTLRNREVPGPEEWMRFIDGWAAIEEIIRSDYQLGRFWLAAWERASNVGLATSISHVAEEMRGYIRRLRELSPNWGKSYRECVEILDGFGARQGTGTNTALSAAFLGWTGQDAAPDDVLRCAANTIGSDTDTIGTMVGALLGVIASNEPSWRIQDREYIRSEALRMGAIARGENSGSFNYPDLIDWQIPSTQTDAVGEVDGRLALAGMGFLEPLGESWKSGEFAFEWFKLAFGQTVLCKRRVKGVKPLNARLLPAALTESIGSVVPVADDGRSDEAHSLTPQTVHSQSRRGKANEDKRSGGRLERAGPTPDMFEDQVAAEPARRADARKQEEAALSVSENSERATLDTLTDVAIRSNFNPTVIGECFLRCIDATDGVERGIAFSAILAKAFLARKRRRG